MMLQSVFSQIFLATLVFLVNAQYPVPIPPGGRMAVHGWLILPWDTNITDGSIQAWFSHHVPAFGIDSPHNFQIILNGLLTPLSCFNTEPIPKPIPIPYPPHDNLLQYEYTITPPPAFSLNDLLLENLTEFKGVIYNGSFDTTYERIPLALGTLTIRQITTAVYLNDSQLIPSYPDLRYLSYPRDMSSSGATKPFQHMYFVHEIHVIPDFDHIIHVSIDTTQCHCDRKSSLLCNNKRILQQIRTPGVEWSFATLTNDVKNRLLPPTIIKGRITNGPVLCPITVLESIHCTIGPNFDKKC
ncbi:unnamed protein product [Rotaria sp. Silwood1]|nr:unnamed protein product [Rotaria sp. Silwood1]CAF0738374.1 unnamed protein product [Rotaria sp. Silwood1]CAF0793209.1 unnamed protein product [Rotaria sp. Silwood1]CAF3333050.1 unnamed protein product [Rotaria sp. Silwood1]CAF3334696.1 unnamed protein product [Rotaria sp. Silwood1]